MYHRFKMALIIGGVAFAAVLFMFSPIFYIQEVTPDIVNGCENIPTSEILTRAGLTKTANLFLFDTSKARKSIMENPYIDSVTFQKILPNRLTITVRERHLSGYVEYMQGKYLYIDENGRVLETNSFYTEKLPVVRGLKYSRVRLGEILEVEDTAAFKTVVTFARLLNKHQLTDLVSRIDVSDGNNTKILVHYMNFNVGDGKNADEKIRTIKEIMEKLPNADIIKGFVDLTEIRSQYYIKILV